MIDKVRSILKRPEERKDEAKIVPLVEKPRYACHFYGFIIFEQLLVDQSGNQCAFLEMGRACIMELCGKVPDWKLCQSFNYEGNKKMVTEILEIIKVCPNEFYPRTKPSWKGIPLKLWFDYVMSPETKRP